MDLNLFSEIITKILHAMSFILQKDIYVKMEQQDPHEFLTDIFRSIYIENSVPNALTIIMVHSKSSSNHFSRIILKNFMSQQLCLQK